MPGRPARPGIGGKAEVHTRRPPALMRASALNGVRAMETLILQVKHVTTHRAAG